jgi:hypothetical protein
MNEVRAKEELHSRLEKMVADVDAVINSQNQPEVQPPAEIELDEVYVDFKSKIRAHSSHSAGFVRNSRTSLTSTS